MIKKKLSTCLLLLLVVLFIRLLGTTCYAYEPTLSELKNFFCNYYKFYYGDNADLTTFKNWLDTKESDLNTWLDNISTYEGQYILSGANGRVNLWFYYGSTSNMSRYGAYKYNYQVGVNTSYLTRRRYDCIITNLDSGFQNYGNYDTYIANNSGQYFFYTDTNIYTNGTIANGSIWRAAGYSSPSDIDLFNGYYTDENFTYVRSELNGLINLNGSYAFGNTAEEILFAYNPFSGDEINEADSVITGYLWDADIFDYAIFTTYKYDYATKQFRYSGDTWTTRNIGQIHDNMYWIEFKATDYGTRLKPDSLLHAEFIPNTNDFNHIHADFYVRSPYTDIVDGVLQVDGTFSGDYALIYNSNSNTDKIIDNDNNNDDFWKKTYDGLFTMNSGDIEDLKNQLDEIMRTGEVSGIYEEINFFERFQNQEPGDLKIQWNPILYENKVIIPSGDINFSGLVRDIPALQEVQRITRVLIIGALAWLALKEVWRTICILLGVGYEIYDTHEEENDIVISQHETWDYNTGQATISTTRRQGRNSVTVRGKAPLRKRIE